MRYVWSYQAIFIGEEDGGTAAYAFIHQIPNMMVTPYIHFFGWNIPGMYNFYLGPWSIYFLTPFVALGGCTIATFRCYSAFMFFFALWGTWRLAMLLSGDEALALLSTLLLAVCPIMITTRSFHVDAPDMAASVWALCFAISFVRSRRPAYAYAACAAFFAGLCTRTWVAGLGVGMALYVALTWRHVWALLPKSRAAKARLIAGCLACAAIFLLPIIILNISYGWPTLKFFAAHMVKRDSVCTQVAGNACSNLDYWTNLKMSVSQLALFCDGDGTLRRQPWHWLYILPLLFSLLYAAQDAKRRRTLWSAPIMLWIVTAGYLMASAVSPTEQIALHLVPLAPILSVLVFFWLSAVPAGSPRKAALIAMILLCAAQFIGDFHLFRRENIDQERAGSYLNSPLVIDACRWAENHPKMPIISLSTAFALAAPYFSQNRARLIWWPVWDPSYPIPWERWLRRKDRPCFVAENDQYGRRNLDELRSQAARLGIPLTLVDVFPDSTGRPGFEVYRAR